MMNPTFNINKELWEKVNKYMKTTFGAITQPHIRILMPKIIIVLALLMFCEERNNPKKIFNVLSCVVYTIIRYYVCIDYLAFE